MERADPPAPPNPPFPRPGVSLAEVRASILAGALAVAVVPPKAVPSAAVLPGFPKKKGGRR